MEPRDLGRRILAALRTYVARSVGELSAKVESLRSAIDNTPTLEIMRGEIDARIAALPAMQAAPALTMEEFRPMVDAEIAKGLLDLERRAQSVLERAIDKMRPPLDGKDGAPGASVEDWGFSLDGRIVTISLKIGGQIQSQSARLDFPIERGVYQAGKAYEKSDIVTFSGSQFIATRDTTEKEMPEKSPAWRLIVKRGKDGKGSE